MAVARLTDPWTSWAAAHSVLDLNEKQAQVAYLFRIYGPMHDGRLISVARAEGIPQSDSGLRTRRSELVSKGYVRDSFATEVLTTGRRSIIWDLRSDLS